MDLLEELGNFGRHSRGSRRGRIIDGNIRAAAEHGSSASDGPQLDVEELDRVGRHVPRGTADLTEVRLERCKAGREQKQHKREKDALIEDRDLVGRAWNAAAASARNQQAPGWVVGKGTQCRLTYPDLRAVGAEWLLGCHGDGRWRSSAAEKDLERDDHPQHRDHG